jgi:hypothetical protein
LSHEGGDTFTDEITSQAVAENIFDACVNIDSKRNSWRQA